jgi:hypothetical protein
MDMTIAPARRRVRVRRGVQVDPHAGGTRCIASAWERLAAGRNPVSDFAYARAWAAGLDGAQRLHVLTAAAERPAIAPLVINRGAAGWLTLLAAEMYEIMDFLYADETPLRIGARHRAHGPSARPEARSRRCARGRGP